MAKSKLHAGLYFVGVLVGFGACVFAGHELSGTTRFDNYVRMFVPIQPQMQYYPSPFQLVNTAAKLYVPGTTLVIVGGSSIFRGTGQNASDLWSKKLQSELGDGYTVVNFSIDQQSMESFGAVAFRILRQKFDKVVYVGLASELGAGPIDGLPVYRYFFWDAYYSGLLNLSERGAQVAKARRASELGTHEGDEVHIGSWLESIFRFRVLWNEVGYRFYFPVWTAPAAVTPFLARDQFKDVDHPDLVAAQKETRENQELREIVKGRMLAVVDRYTEGNPPRLRESAATDVRKSYDDAFASEDRSRILAVFLRANPYHMDLLGTKKAGLRTISDRASEIVKSLGYRSIVIGDGFLPDDYVDHGHLMASGGAKLAHQVAEEVRVMSRP